MKIPSGSLILLLIFAGCSSRSDEAYQRLLQLTGIETGPGMRRVEFIKTSGIDPYYLAKLAASSAVSPTDILRSPADWQITQTRFVSPPPDIDWWRPGELDRASVWTPKAKDSPSYTEVVIGHSGGVSVIYVAWQKTAQH